ncbi:MAG: hypothetical protein ACJ8GK_04525 [Luteimonas sp.]
MPRLTAPDPEGAAHVDVRRFQSSQNGESENPRLDRVDDLALSGKAAFFWLLFFEARKEK